MTLNSTIKKLIILITISLSSCSLFQQGLVLHPREMQPFNSNISPNFPDYGIKNIAVLPFKESAKTEGGMYVPQYATMEHTPIPKFVHLQNDGEIAARLMENALLATFKYQPVDRTMIDQLIEEMEFQLSANVNQETVVRIGNLTGADAVLSGTVNQALAALQYQSYGDVVYAAYIGYVHLELRLTDVETGDVIWLCEIQRNSLNYIDKSISISNSKDIQKVEQFGGPSQNDIVMFVMRKAMEEAVSEINKI